MIPHDWQRIEAIVADALELDPAGRAVYLDQACNGDAALRREVESLLACDGQAHDVISAAVGAGAMGVLTDNQSLREGDRIGAYRVIREIGRGGMGTVYLAHRDDDQFQKQVAIKLVTRGMDTSMLLERFRRERQILARLDHPFIARLLDGGSTADGRPYLVMEYVEGQPITVWCSEHRSGLRDRLELFRKVCAAVQSAHQNLVIHRDLKPGNILVDSGGTPKLLDFGIAKLLDQDTSRQLTMEAGVRMFTPDYASPEQVRGQGITTAADVYSLGAILYELLTGVPPHSLREAGPATIEHAICDVDPGKPSTMATELKVPPGDLDNIVLMALQKDPLRRYVSASEFSEDLRRYLEGLPVRAREDTVFYRTAKFVRRHRAGVAAAILLVASLAGGITLSTIQARRAERRFTEVRRLAHAVLYDIYDSIRDLPGSVNARELVLTTALRYLDGLSREAAGDPELRQELAETYQRVADVEGGSGEHNLGKTPVAVEAYRKAMVIADGLSGQGAQAEKRDMVRMRARMQLALLGAVDGLAASLRLYAEAIAIGEQAFRDGHTGTEMHRALSEVYAAASRDEPDNAKGVNYARKAVELLESSEHTQEDLQCDLADRYSNLSSRLTRGNRAQEALDSARKMLVVREGLVTAHPLNSRYRRDLMIGYSKVGDAWHQMQGGDGPALENYNKALAIAEKHATDDPKDYTAMYDVGMALWKVALVTSDTRESMELLIRSNEIIAAQATIDPGNPRRNRQYMFTLEFIAERQMLLGDTAAAIRSYRQVIRMSDALLQKSPNDVLVLGYSWRGGVEIARRAAIEGRRSEALELSAKALQQARHSSSLDANNPVTLVNLPQTFDAIGDIHASLASLTAASNVQRRGDWLAARDAYQTAALEWDRIPAAHVGKYDREAMARKSRAEAARAAQAAGAVR